MGLLQRLQTWISDHFRRSDDSESVADDDAPEPDDPEPRLDPAATTEARSGSTDEAVDKLNAVRNAAAADEPAASEESGEQADESTAAADDRGSS